MTEIFTKRQKRIIAGRSRTLLERIANPDALVHGERNEAEVKEVFQAWKEMFPSEEAFDQRLEHEGVSRQDCRKAISSGKLDSSETLPEWISLLDELVAAVQKRDPENVSLTLDQRESDYEMGNDRHFREITAAIAAHVRDEFLEESVRNAFSKEIIDVMIEWFRHRFEIRFTRILYVEFKSFIAHHDRELAFSNPDEFEELPTEYYDEFIKYIFTGGIADLCVEYPIFARLLVIQMQQWKEHFREFCNRLQEDRELIADQFDIDGGLGDVIDLKPLADDTHGDGRAVMRVGFKSGHTVVYKPRSVKAGAIFYQVLDQLNDYLPVPDFEAPTYVVRDDYGWMEWIENGECPDREAVERYYQRVGSLISISYFLEFSDCHYENFIATGEYPVLVDAETVFHPYIGISRKPTRSGPGMLVDNSVLLSSLLPYGSEDMYDDIDVEMLSGASGIGVSSEDFIFDVLSFPQIKASNTDVMSVEPKPGRIRRDDNIPKINNTDQPPEEYLAAIVNGFKSTYETIMNLRDSGCLADEIGFYTAFESVENRVVYRPTQRYASILRSLSSRACLQDGARFGIEMEQLAVPFCDGQVTEPQPWPLYDAERRALKRYDPPRFTCQTDKTAIRMDGMQLNVKADTSGMQRSRDRIESADRADMREQVELIRRCFEMTPTASQDMVREPTVERKSVNNKQLQQEAERIFKHVRTMATETNDGTYHWTSIKPEKTAETEPLTLRPTDGSVYIGRCGIAIFGAGLYHLTGEDQYREFALKTVRPIREAVQSEQRVPALTNIGGAVGIGSVAYGLTVVSDLLNEQTILADAIRSVDFITEDLIEMDDSYDVIAGAAGTIHGILATHERENSSELVSAAATCGDHLLDNRVTKNGCRVWKTLNDSPPLTGFAHGISGIAYALLRLWDATEDRTYREAALEALEYEAQTYSKTAKNWPDERERTEETYPDQWCYGRSGIGLSRLGMAEYATDDLITQGIERAVNGAVSDEARPFDHLCCGNAGRAEFLIEANERYNQCSGMARELLGGALERKRQTGTYQTLFNGTEIIDPTFFHGISGIGYSMLRIIDPKTLPCVLLWE